MIERDDEERADLARMVDWLLWAMACYAVMYVLRAFDVAPQWQTLMWKLGNVATAGFAGYWLDRRLFRKRITADSHPLQELRRAILVVGAIAGVCLGL
jgi:hypothetical protein